MESIKYQGKIVEVVEKEVVKGEKKKIFEFARRSPGVRIIADNGNQILLTREYRREAGGYDTRLPGGKVFDRLEDYNEALRTEQNIDEAANLAARKEAKEEAGIEAKTIQQVHKSICGATVMWDLYYFLTTDFVQGEQKLEEGEDISVGWVDKNKVKEMCLKGEIGEERSALVLLRYLGGHLKS
jgi:8-oxo-dGTP pyrophosphatase MutT (NUDIX family)